MDDDFSPERSIYFRATKEALVFEVFEARDFGSRKGDEASRVVFRYSDRMTRKQMMPIFETMLDNEKGLPEPWLGLGNLMPADLRDRMTEKFIECNGLSVAAEIGVARYLHREKRSDEALARLRKAYFAALIDGSNDSSEILKLGRQITEDKKWKPENPTLEDLKVLGVRSGDLETPFETEVALGEPLRFVEGAGDEISIFSVVVIRSEIPEGVFSIHTSHYALNRGSRSSSYTTPHITSRPWKSSTSSHMRGTSREIDIEEIEGVRFRVAIKGR
jgi:hypothetical protein